MKITWLVFNPIAKIILLPGYTRRYKLKLIFNYLKLEIKHSIHKKKNEKQIKTNVLGYKVHSIGYGNLLCLFREIFIEEQYFFKTMNNQPAIIDLGANIGLASLYFKQLYPNCHIFAVEPEKTSYELYKLNMRENNINDTEIINAAVTDKEGLIEFYYDPKSPTSLVNSIVFELMPKNVTMINSMTLSSFIEDKKIDFVKIDVEGAERFITTDLSQKNKLNKIKEYIVEYHYFAGDPEYLFSSFLSVFEKHGYTCQVKGEFKYKENFSILLLNCHLNDIDSHKKL